LKQWIDKILDWLINGPENKLLRYLVYWPVFLIVGSITVFFVIGILPELVAWAFGFSCLVCAVVWPVAKTYEWITGKKVW